jgi:hypothetical protein
MTTSEIEEIVYSAFTSNTDLMGLLPNGDKSIFHLQAPETYPELPVLVYSPNNDDPALHADNKEYLHRVIIRIHIVTRDGDYYAIDSKIRWIMADLDFIRLRGFPFTDSDGNKIWISDFKKITGV